MSELAKESVRIFERVIELQFQKTGQHVLPGLLELIFRSYSQGQQCSQGRHSPHR
jgi:hypothetical protein